MDSKYFKILQELKEKAGIGVNYDISPILLTFYPTVNKMDAFSVREAGSEIDRILNEMKEDGFINLQRYISLGSGNETNGYTWLDLIHINASLRQRGATALEEEMNKGIVVRVQESIIDTNNSVKETNRSTKNLYENILPNTFKDQNKSANLSLILAGVSVVFIGVSALLQWNDKTSTEVQQLKLRLDTTSKTLESIGLSLKQIDSSIQKRKIDTVFVKKN